jgi:hypothetical protein
VFPSKKEFFVLDIICKSGHKATPVKALETVAFAELGSSGARNACQNLVEKGWLTRSGTRTTGVSYAPTSYGKSLTDDWGVEPAKSWEKRFRRYERQQRLTKKSAERSSPDTATVGASDKRRLRRSEVTDGRKQ